VIGFVRVLAGFAKLHDLIAQYICLDGSFGQRPLLNHFLSRIVAKPTNVAALRLYDRVEERELGIAAVHHIQAVFLNGSFSDGSLVVVATTVGSHVDASWHVAINFKMRVQSPLNLFAAFSTLKNGGLHDARKC
jgi:hypothetical protein